METGKDAWAVYVGEPKENAVTVEYGGMTAMANLHVVRRLLEQLEAFAIADGRRLSVTYHDSVPEGCRLGWGDRQGPRGPSL